MRNILKSVLSASCLVISGAIFVTGVSSAAYAAKVGDKAPDFTLTDSNGKTHTLSSYQGKTVVLEWFNKGCPFVQKHYGSGNMQSLQKKYTADGTVWLTINSAGGKGKEGFETPAEAGKTRDEWKIASTATLFDTDGKVGKDLYQAKTTPHMFVINENGIITYAGAIDSIPTAEKTDVRKAVNYVAAALDAMKTGASIKVASSKPYGCSVKY